MTTDPSNSSKSVLGTDQKPWADQKLGPNLWDVQQVAVEGRIGIPAEQSQKSFLVSASSDETTAGFLIGKH